MKQWRDQRLKVDNFPCGFDQNRAEKGSFTENEIKLEINGIF